MQQFGSAGTQVGVASSNNFLQRGNHQIWIGSHYRRRIIQSFRKICIG